MTEREEWDEQINMPFDQMSREIAEGDDRPDKYDDDGTLNEDYIEWCRTNKPDGYKYIKDSPARKCNSWTMK